MNISKIKVIENPVEEFRLSSESMEALLGGSDCIKRVGNTCNVYKAIGVCGSKEEYCDNYSW